MAQAKSKSKPKFRVGQFVVAINSGVGMKIVVRIDDFKNGLYIGTHRGPTGDLKDDFWPYELRALTKRERG